MDTPQTTREVYESTRKGNSSELGKGLLIFAISMMLLFAFSCSKEEVPQPSKSVAKINPEMTSTASSLLTLGSDTVKARFYIANDTAQCRVRNFIPGPIGATMTTAAAQSNGDYLVNVGSNETFTVSMVVGQTVRTMQLLIENPGNDTIRITCNNLFQIDAPNAQIVNANAFLISTVQSQLFRVIAVPPVLSQAVSGPTYAQ